MHRWDRCLAVALAVGLDCSVALDGRSRMTCFAILCMTWIGRSWPDDMISCILLGLGMLFG